MLDKKLTLIIRLLKKQEPNQRLIKDSLKVVMKALNDNSGLFNEQQQEQWLIILKMIKHRNNKTEEIARKWCGFDYLYPQHRQSFVVDVDEKNEPRIKQSKIFSETRRAIWTRIDGSDTGPSLIGIKSDMWKIGLFEENEG